MILFGFEKFLKTLIIVLGMMNIDEYKTKGYFVVIKIVHNNFMQ